MKTLRQHLHLVTTIWLLCQTLSVSAFMPRLCCPEHDGQAAAAGDDHCARTAAADECPMAGPDGQPCPEHANGGSHADCVMRGTCAAPAVALLSLFSVPGILADGTRVPADLASAAFVASPHAATSVPAPHDTPPPRS